LHSGSVEARSHFKVERQCKPFQWFLDNIYPEKFILDSPDQVYAYGRLKNPTSLTCLDNLQSDDKVMSGVWGFVTFWHGSGCGSSHPYL
jgi:polypeptide N-acetylgalactosaminyltransferase